MFEINDKSIQLLKSVIENYLDRQQIVAYAMVEIYPRPFVTSHISNFRGIELAPLYLAWQEKVRLDRDWQRGIWREVWSYWLHGAGRRLTHLQTGEPIEWDA